MLLIFKSSSHSKFLEISGPEHLSTVLVPLQDDLDPAERSGRFLKERLFCRLEGFWRSWNCWPFPLRVAKAWRFVVIIMCSVRSQEKGHESSCFYAYLGEEEQKFGVLRWESRWELSYVVIFGGWTPKHESQTCNPGTWSFEGIATEQLKVQWRF